MECDLVAYGVPFIANPDLVARYETDALKHLIKLHFTPIR
jgi:2,4-dienoyl-CoA reductase-like NADH-dependent reductase (Old Yellow Enzyme family)